MEGRTTLIIAHRLSTIALADRVVLLDQHKVVADGTHAQLLETTPLYAEVLAQAGEFEAEADRAEADRAEAEQTEGTGTAATAPVPDGQPLRDLLDSVRGGGRP
jgi:ABC-type multidrug transport system ATPase subunit